MKILVLGGGSFGTALANEMAFNENHSVTILLRDKQVKEKINQEHFNSKYFPNRKLNESLRATDNLSAILTSEVIFIAIPSRNIPEIVSLLKKHLNPNTLLVNVSKGILKNGMTIVDFLKRELQHDEIITLKGASFGAEVINRSPTLMTVGFENKDQLSKMDRIFKPTSIFLDYTTDIRGIELLSALKNIYAILIGYVDARYNAANTRFLFLTKTFEEIKVLLKELGGQVETLSLSCGIGDISLTGLNDLSRNRTLGLLIGKGFYNSLMESNSIVLEGVNSLKFVDQTISNKLHKKIPLFKLLTNLIVNRVEEDLTVNFDELFRKKYETILTYGTFDLLHYGHLEILRKAKALGDRLIVGLSTDTFNEVKGKNCIIKYEKRKQLLESLPYVDLVIPEKEWGQKAKDIQKHHVDTFVMGGDWKGKFDEMKKYCAVKYFDRTKGISTSKLKSIL